MAGTWGRMEGGRWVVSRFTRVQRDRRPQGSSAGGNRVFGDESDPRGLRSPDWATPGRASGSASAKWATGAGRGAERWRCGRGAGGPGAPKGLMHLGGRGPSRPLLRPRGRGKSRRGRGRAFAPARLVPVPARRPRAAAPRAATRAPRSAAAPARAAMSLW